MARRVRANGAPTALRVEDIVRAGRELGMARLSLGAVATELGVSTPALYRHIGGRWELDRLVGESLLADLELRDDPAEGVEAHLLSFGMQLREFVLARPGLGAYLQVLFPRGPAGRELLATEVRMLGARGYPPASAIMLSGAVATLTIGFAVAEERREAAADPSGYEREVQAATGKLAEDPELGPVYTGLPAVSPRDYTQALLTAAISGIVAAAPPDRPVDDVLARLLAAHRTEDKD